MDNDLEPRASEASPQTATASPARSSWSRFLWAGYALALVASVSVWFLPIRAPLWLDETGSFQQIAGGFSQISQRQGLSFSAYSYILWFCTKILGTSEVALRIPEILATLGALLLLYLAARELFDTDVAVLAVVVFSLNPILAYIAIDVRPYAFAVLAISASTYLLLRLRRSHSYWLAALFGFSAACIVYFQFLFAVILPGLAVAYWVMKEGERKIAWRQFGIALAVFAVAIWPAIPEVNYTVRSAGTHVFETAPELADLWFSMAPRNMGMLVLAVVFLAAIARRLDLRGLLDYRRVAFCALLGLFPILCLYGVSVATPLHVFVERYRVVALPGVALCWALLISLVSERWLRLLFCVVLVALSVSQDYRSPLRGEHGYTWKYALEYVQKNASVDNAPVLICSDFVESNIEPIPAGEAVKQSALFAPLSYYQLTVPVIGLPRALNDKTKEISANFLATARHRRFLAVACSPSYATLRWLVAQASATHRVRELGTSNQILVLEFTPRQ